MPFPLSDVLAPSNTTATVPQVPAPSSITPLTTNASSISLVDQQASSSSPSNSSLANTVGFLAAVSTPAYLRNGNATSTTVGDHTTATTTSGFPTLTLFSNGYTYQPRQPTAQSTGTNFPVSTGTASADGNASNTTQPTSSDPSNSTVSSPAPPNTGNDTRTLPQDTTSTSAPSSAAGISASTLAAAPQLGAENGTSVGSAPLSSTGNSTSLPSQPDAGNGTSNVPPSSQPDTGNNTITANGTSTSLMPSSSQLDTGSNPSSASPSSPSPDPNTSTFVGASIPSATGLPYLPTVPPRYRNSTADGNNNTKPSNIATPTGSDAQPGPTSVASASALLASRGLVGPSRNEIYFTSAATKRDGSVRGVWFGVALVGIVLVL
ncbi:hypothetical protein MMC13_007935 [Lambiella insularis]|nr:hypothetical protein [Lambiella insularis]